MRGLMPAFLAGRYCSKIDGRLEEVGLTSANCLQFRCVILPAVSCSTAHTRR